VKYKQFKENTQMSNLVGRRERESGNEVATKDTKENKNDVADGLKNEGESP